ncbi:efflux RND transporter periplasmic adaptor subunit [Qipengyuania spongiae]|uniref:Efflux RND transporter periplasmic adaptor subunit n=1 Tax=Qipengyuania spongiae TaxID=2909673 RepID=A0ABY5SZW7_9SPHN|nr:efflux RND transporter periplasmic adaptor subunit [Qipengyuania spongiae]UVI40057.1 efflux RND transporter periplasmic adaptor subunit [Qipengyuania spongiae]
MNYETRVTGESAKGFGTDGSDVVTAPSRPRWVWIVVVVAIIAVAFLAWRLTSSSDTAPAADRESQLPVVTVVVPGQTTVEGEINTAGTLAARRALPVGVVGEGGRVVSVPVDAGDWVRAGQVLASIDRSVQNQQSQSASAQISVAQADADLAQSNLDRALQLVERGFISKADIDRLTATRDAAVARVRVAQAQLGELRARNDRLNIVAPASGLVLERNVEPGQTVTGGANPLFLIASGGEMELRAEVGENELASLSVGETAEITPVGSGESFTGRIWQVSPTIDPQNRQGTARIALSYAPQLRPGGFASAVIRSGTVVAPVLPESAIQTDEQGSYVFIVGSDNVVERRNIQTGRVTAQGIVVSGGLRGSERVVLRAGGFLNPGDEVSPVRQ